MSKTSASRRYGRSRRKGRALALALALVPICLGLAWWSAAALVGADPGAAVAVLGDSARRPVSDDGAATRAGGSARGEQRPDARSAPPAGMTVGEGTESGAEAATEIDRIADRGERLAALSVHAIGLPVGVPSEIPAGAQGDTGQETPDGAATGYAPAPVAATGAGHASVSIDWSGAGLVAPTGVAPGSGLPIGGPAGLGGSGAGGTAFGGVPATGAAAPPVAACPPGGCPVLATALSSQALARTAELTRSLTSSDLESVGAAAGSPGDGAGSGVGQHESGVAYASTRSPEVLPLSTVGAADPPAEPLPGTQSPAAAEPVPVPSTALLLLAGAGALLRHARRRAAA